MACTLGTGFFGARAAAFFSAFNFAHRIRWALAILFRAAADTVRLALADFRALILAHLARCAAAILRRPAADILRRGCPIRALRPLRAGLPALLRPVDPSKTEIASSSRSTSRSARFLSCRNSCTARPKLSIDYLSYRGT